MAFKVCYIQAFNAMEAELREPRGMSEQTLLAAVKEIVAPLAVRFDAHSAPENNHYRGQTYVSAAEPATAYPPAVDRFARPPNWPTASRAVRR